MWELGLLPWERLVGLATFFQAALGSLISTSPCGWIANQGHLLSSTWCFQHLLSPVGLQTLDWQQSGVLADLSSSSCTGRVVQDQWVLLCDLTLKGAGREGRAHPTCSQLRLLGESCLQLSEQ